MNNLTQQQRNAKRAHLDEQQAQMLEHYKTVSEKERAAIIRQINGFLPVTHSESEKAFWIEFRDKLEKVE
ncbi:MAG TPA: hypothetical protein PKE69_06675 [Pyrinomonadaceae bacterium]|nr:hypothetical protein [Pyrinomonadaceae bacterium]